MQVYSVDLAAWYAAGRWVGLLDLIDGLPMASRLRGATYDDPEDAELLARMPEPEEDWAPPTAEFGLVENLLTDLIDEQKRTRAELISVMGGKPAKEKGAPRPTTLASRLRREARQREEHEWAAEFVQLLGFNADDI